jgi:thymidylate synthase ThyX
MIEAKIVTDSKDNRGNRITTMLVTLPRFLLAELNTHRLFSRNSASSRAIPFNKMVQSVQDNPFIPIAWQKEHSGMQGSEYFTDDKDISWFIMNHLKARNQAVERATDANDKKLTKQLCNRLLEPFMYHTVLITATEFSNFFSLRCSQYTSDKGEIFKSKKDFRKDKNNIEENFHYPITDLGWLNINKGQSEIHMMALAEAMYDVYNESKPKLLNEDEWHIPFNVEIDDIGLYLPIPPSATREEVELLQVKIATARCARTSYTVFGENKIDKDYKKDIQLFDRLLESGHWSPMEHCAKVMTENEYESFYKGFGANEGHTGRIENQGWCNNFKGFIQYRYLLEN